MRTHRNSNTEILEKETHQLNHDRQPKTTLKGCQSIVLLVSKNGTVIQSEVRPTVVQLKR